MKKMSSEINNPPVTLWILKCIWHIFNKKDTGQTEYESHFPQNMWNDSIRAYIYLHY